MLSKLKQPQSRTVLLECVFEIGHQLRVIEIERQHILQRVEQTVVRILLETDTRISENTTR